MTVATRAIEASATLAAVQDRIDATLDDLARLWQEVACREADVLGDQDLPALIRRVAGGGKMIRPEMVHWGWVCAGAPRDARPQVVSLGAAVELLHLFALVHDDVMDRSELRRGRATTHVVARRAFEEAGGHGEAAAFGDAVAVLAGDLIHSEATLLVADLPPAVRAAWRRMMVELVLGQRRDLTGAALGRRDLGHAIEVARLKTGAYTVTGPLRMGALLGEADPALVTALEEFGRHLGEAFGLRDDILGMWGDPAATGKSVQDDLVDGKATVLLALGHDRLGEEGRGLLARVGDLSADEMERLRAELSTCGVREAVEAMIGDEVGRALEALETDVVHPEGRAGLTELAHRIAWRQA